MKKILIAICLSALCNILIAQNIIRVKSGENIQAIIDNLNTEQGSILILDPGSYESVTVYKKVTIIGSGFFNGLNTSNINKVNFDDNNNTTSEGSVMMGCNANAVTIRTNNVVINRCRFNTFLTGVDIGNVAGVRLSQCFIDGDIYIGNKSSNYIIQNNIILKQINSFLADASSSGLIRNNTVYNIGNNCDPISFSSAINGVKVINNIFICPVTCDNRNGNNNYATNIFAQFNNNIVRKGNYQGVDSNKFLTDMATIFTLVGTPDSKFILSANSPAKGAGEGGVDCGAFGGTEPYIVGGSPLGPVIEDIIVPTTARQNETIKIKLKAKIQN
jgi:hypothetical protein